MGRVFLLWFLYRRVWFHSRGLFLRRKGLDGFFGRGLAVHLLGQTHLKSAFGDGAMGGFLGNRLLGLFPGPFLFPAGKGGLHLFLFALHQQGKVAAVQFLV